MLDNVTSFDSLLAIVLPFIVAAIFRFLPNLDKNAKLAISLLLAVVLAGVRTTIEGKFNVHDLAESVIYISAVSQVLYLKVLKTWAEKVEQPADDTPPSDENDQPTLPGF